MGDFINDWNNTVSGFEIRPEDLTKPSSMFFITALTKILDSLDVQTEDLIKAKSKPSNVLNENWEACNELIPLLNICEAINYLLKEIHPESSPITVSDLMMPNKHVVERVLLVLHNFYLFANDRQKCIADSEEGIQEWVERSNMMLVEIDKLKIEIDNQQLENDKTEKHIQHTERSIQKLKHENAQVEETVNELKSEFDALQEQLNGDADLQKQQFLQSTLIEEISRLKSLILSETQQTEVVATKESISQKAKVLEEKTEEIKANLWRKESDIKTLESIMLNLKELQLLLDNLEILFNGMKDAKCSNETTNEKEIECNRLHENIAVAHSKIENLSKIHHQLVSDHQAIEKEFTNENETFLREQHNATDENKRYEKEINELQTNIECLKNTALKYNSAYKTMIDSYIHKIPESYDAAVEEHLFKIKSIIKNLNNVSL